MLHERATRREIKSIVYGNIIKNKNKTGKSENISKDTKNRKDILQILVNDIANGATEEEAIQNIMKSPIVENLKYLDNLPEVFRNWIKTDMTKKMIFAKKREIQNQKQISENKETTIIDIDEDER